MGIGTIYHIGAAVFDVATGNYLGAIEEGCAAVQGVVMGEILSPITEPLKEYFGDAVAETCDPDIVDNFPYF